jgi:hypothetical protein
MGALFSIVAVVPREKLRVAENGDKLQVVDPKAANQRHACKGCGVHMEIIRRPPGFSVRPPFLLPGVRPAALRLRATVR